MSQNMKNWLAIGAIFALVILGGYKWKQWTDPSSPAASSVATPSPPEPILCALHLKAKIYGEAACSKRRKAQTALKNGHFKKAEEYVRTAEKYEEKLANLDLPD